MSLATHTLAALSAVFFFPYFQSLVLLKARSSLYGQCRNFHDIHLSQCMVQPCRAFCQQQPCFLPQRLCQKCCGRLGPENQGRRQLQWARSGSSVSSFAFGFPVRHNTAPGGTMMTWKDIFKEKLAEMHLTDLWTLQEDNTLQVQALGPDWKEFVQHRALGRFQCSQCYHKWSSAKVHILFHMWQCPGWGMVWMRVFRQKCRHCPKPQLEDPEFSQETMERILHNLVVKILQYFYNKPVQPSNLLDVVVDAPVTGPHDSTHCEGCQLGICNKSRQAPTLDPWKGFMDVNKDRTHHTKSWRAPAWVGWKRLTDADVSLKRQGLLGPHAASTHHLSPCNNNFPWKRCCCIGSCLLCVLAVIIFIVVYFTSI